MAKQVLLITGAAGVLGRAVVETALGRGWTVVGADLAAPDHADSETFLGLTGVDLTDPAAAAAMVETARTRFGRLDALINVVGGFVWQTTLEGDLASWETMWRLNVLPVLHACRAAAPGMKAQGSGRIVNVGAGGAVKAAAGMGAYAAAKSGVHRLTEGLAEELKGTGVTVNAVLPSIIDTPVNRADMPDADFGAWVTPEEVAQVLLFLAGEDAGGVTGALVPVVGRV